MKIFKKCKKKEQLDEMRNLMKTRDDYKSMRLPRSFADTQVLIFGEDNSEQKANKVLKPTR